MKDYEDLAESLLKIGWSCPNDAQWTRLKDFYDGHISFLRAERDDALARVGELITAIRLVNMNLGYLCPEDSKNEHARNAVEASYLVSEKALSLPTLGAYDRLRNEVWREAEKTITTLAREMILDRDTTLDILHAIRAARPSAFKGEK